MSDKEHNDPGETGPPAEPVDEPAGVFRDLGPAILDASPGVPSLRATWNGDGATIDRLPASAPTSGKVHFDGFFLEYWPKLTRRLLGPCRGDRGLAEDLAQEALYATYRRMDRVVNPQAYSYIVACRAAQKHFERQEMEVDRLRKLAAALPEATRPDGETACDDLLRGVVTDRQRKIMMYRFVEDRPLKWIAETLKVSVRTVNYEIRDAFGRLRAHLDLGQEDS